MSVEPPALCSIPSWRRRGGGAKARLSALMFFIRAPGLRHLPATRSVVPRQGTQWGTALWHRVVNG